MKALLKWVKERMGGIGTSESRQLFQEFAATGRREIEL